MRTVHCSNILAFSISISLATSKCKTRDLQHIYIYICCISGTKTSRREKHRGNITLISSSRHSNYYRLGHCVQLEQHDCWEGKAQEAYIHIPVHTQLVRCEVIYSYTTATGSRVVLLRRLRNSSAYLVVFFCSPGLFDLSDSRSALYSTLENTAHRHVPRRGQVEEREPIIQQSRSTDIFREQPNVS